MSERQKNRVLKPLKRVAARLPRRRARWGLPHQGSYRHPLAKHSLQTQVGKGSSGARGAGWNPILAQRERNTLPR